MTSGVVDKLMDGAVDNLGQPRSSVAPKVSAQAAHELLHNKLFG